MPFPSAKTLRSLRRPLDRLFGRASLLPPTPENFGEVKSPLSRWVRITWDRSFVLSADAYYAMREIATLLDDCKAFDERAEYSDIYAACEEMLKNAVIAEERPDTGEEAFALISSIVEKRIKIFRFAVPLLGMELKGCAELNLGNFLVCRPSIEILKRFDRDTDSKRVVDTIEDHKHHLWLVGSAIGTDRVAMTRFRSKADQLTGFIAVYLGTMFERGGVGFSVHVATSAEEHPNRSAWLSWTDDGRDITTHFQFLKSQVFEVDAEHASRLEGSLLRYCFDLIEKKDPAPFESALLRAVIWLDDASHERLLTMRLLKLWSCAEVFFSTRENTAEAVCRGVLSSLVAGPDPLIAPSKASETLATLKKLYDKRSRATHDAAHADVSYSDCVKLTEFVCRMLLLLIEFGTRGVQTVEIARSVLSNAQSDPPGQDQES